MKEFFKDKTWDDYLLMGILGLIFFSLAILAIGLLFSVKFNNPTIPGIPIDLFSQKVSIFQILFGKGAQIVSAADLDTTNLFTLMGDLTPELGAIYTMAALAVSGFALLMTSFALVICLIIGSFVYEKVVTKLSN